MYWDPARKIHAKKAVAEFLQEQLPITDLRRIQPQIRSLMAANENIGLIKNVFLASFRRR
jgi:hypothetical protein